MVDSLVPGATHSASPCTSCGACCAHFRCSFYWGETDSAPGGTVPTALTEKLNDFRVAMKGMSGRQPRCVALLGTIGESVRCTIYESRASVCRDFRWSWQDGEHNPRCDAARAAWGLPPLEPPVNPSGDPHEPLPLIA